jgi:hypothetical protein
MAHNGKRSGEEGCLHALLVSSIKLVAHLDAAIEIAAKSGTDDRAKWPAKDIA